VQGIQRGCWPSGGCAATAEVLPLHHDGLWQTIWDSHESLCLAHREKAVQGWYASSHLHLAKTPQAPLVEWCRSR
jgi:hypothetical protein